MLTHVERAMRQGRELVSPEERAQIDAAVRALSEVRDTDDRERIHDCTIALNRATEHLAELMMDAALRAAVQSKRADEIMESS